jgi:predicted DNA-binding protein
MKDITIKIDESFYKRLNEVRRKEAPNIRNSTFCKELIEAMVGALEDDYLQGEKSGKQNQPNTTKPKPKRKRTRKTKVQ